jgi:hypothetical protein
MLGACGFGAVEVPAASQEPGTQGLCATLVADLPEVVDDAVRRDLAGQTSGAAVWGQPPIILRCGVPPPSGVDPTQAVLEVAGVGWSAVPGEGGTFFYALDRAAIVEVAIPADYAPEAQVLIDLADAVAQVPLTAAPAAEPTPW